MSKRLFLVAACIIIVLSLFLSPAFAAYGWVDDKGEFHITDYPKPVKREEPKEAAPEAATPSAAPEVKQSPLQTAPVAPTPPPTPAAATVPSSTGTSTIKPLLPAAAGMPSSAGTPTMRPAAPLSQLTPTPAGHDAMATGETVSLLTTTATTTVPLSAMQEQPQTGLPVPEDPMSAEGIRAFVMASFMIILVLSAVTYVYFSLCLYLIAKKLNVSAPWTAWVPIVNIWTILQAAGKPCWWVLLFFIPLVGFIVIVYVWMCIVENLGRNKWLGLLLLIPIVSLVYIGVLAFSKEEHQEELHERENLSGQEWKPSEDSSEEPE